MDQLTRYELYELIDYSNKTLIIQDDIEFRKCLFEIIIQQLTLMNFKNNFYADLFRIIMTVLTIKYEYTNSDINKLIHDLKTYM